MHDDDRDPELSPPPATLAIVWRTAPIVVAALIGAGCGDPGDPLAYDAGISVEPDGGAATDDAGPPDAGPIAYDAGITPPSDSGASE